jgi:C4-dicarboxylate transporter, DctM subunit
MSPELFGAAAIGILLVLIFVGFPIWISMIAVGTFGYFVLVGWNPSMTMVAQNVVGSLQSYSFSVLAIFLIMGEFADISGMMKEAYQSIVVLAGRLRGSLAMASILGAAAFSCVSGSSAATAAIMSNVALPQLLEHKYDKGLSVGALAAGGTLGNLIPPGALLIVYAVMTQVSLGQFFIACLIPGFLLTIMYLAQIWIQCKIDPSLCPPGTSTTIKQKTIALKGLIAVFVVFVIIMGGIQFGIFTPNEAAAISTVIVFIYALARKTFTRKNLLQSLKNTLATTGMIMAVIVGANIFNSFIAVSGLGQAMAEWLAAIHVSGLGLVIILMVIYFILGIALDPIAVLLLTLPIMLPVLNAFHVDLLWFGVLAIIQCELGNLTPPVGMNLFIVAAAAKPKGITMADVFKGSIPFCITGFIFLIIIVAFPQISLFLVSLMGT